jgi:hypothetical protein
LASRLATKQTSRLPASLIAVRIAPAADGAIRLMGGAAGIPDYKEWTEEKPTPLSREERKSNQSLTLICRIGLVTLIRTPGAIGAHDSVKARFRTKVQQKPHVQLRSREIAPKLPVIRQWQIMGRFHFDNDFVLDEKIQSLERDDLLEELNGNQHFPLYFVPELAKGPGERLDVNPFEEPVAKLVIDEVEGPNDRLGDLTMEQLDCLFCRNHSARSASSAQSASPTDFTAYRFTPMIIGGNGRPKGERKSVSR